MVKVKLFESYLESVLENERADLSLKMSDAQTALNDLKDSLKEIGASENPDPIKLAITQLKIQKQNLKSQMLQLDLRILSLKEKSE
jgi:hypothetical protein